MHHRLFRALLLSIVAFSLLISADAQLQHPIDVYEIGVGSVDGIQFEGASEVDLVGASVSGVGDFNGDGFEDFLIGVPGEDRDGFENVGGACLVYGTPDGFPTSGHMFIDELDGTNGFLVLGIEEDDYAGFYCSGGGDFNGDGFSDLLCSFHSSDPMERENAGTVYVIFGSALTVTNSGVFDLSEAHGSRVERVAGPVAGAYVRGRGIGDLNGDGFDDMLIKCALVSPVAYVMFGSADGFSASSAVDLADGVGADLVYIVGPTGVSGSGVGDVNGDGYNDIMFGNPMYEVDGEIVGETFLLFGSAQGIGGSDTVYLTGPFSNPSLGVHIVGVPYEVATIGWDLNAAGDVNADGIGDMSIGGQTFRPGSSGATVIVVHGAPNLGGSTHEMTLGSLDGENGWYFDGGEYGAEWFHQGAGDVNGDGICDLMVGSPLYGTPGLEAGQVHVVYGTTAPFGIQGWVSWEWIDGVHAAELNGPEAHIFVGGSVSTAGDANGDGLSDILFGGPYFSRDNYNILDLGKAFLVFGRGQSQVTTHRNWIHTGETPMTGVGMVGNGSHSIPLSRCWLGFDGGSGPGVAGASFQTITRTPSDVQISGLGSHAMIANVMWQVETNRTGHSQLRGRFKYLDDEIGGLDENAIRVCVAPSPNGPWGIAQGQHPMPERNQIEFEMNTGVRASLFFALADVDIPVGLTPSALATQLVNSGSPPATSDINGDGDVDAVDLVWLINATPISP